MSDESWEARIKMAATNRLGKTTRVQHMARIVELETENRILKLQLADAEAALEHLEHYLGPSASVEDYRNKWRKPNAAPK